MFSLLHFAKAVRHVEPGTLVGTHTIQVNGGSILLVDLERIGYTFRIHWRIFDTYVGLVECKENTDIYRRTIEHM